MQIINWMQNRKEDKFIQRLEKDIHSKKYQKEKEAAIDFKKKKSLYTAFLIGSSYYCHGIA